MPSPTTRQLLLAVIGVGLLISPGCGGDGWADQPISHVTASGDGRTLDVGWHCHREVRATAEESDDEVRIRLRVHTYKGDCAATESVTLAAPLDGRTLIDATTGEVVTPCPAAMSDSTPTLGCP